MKLLQKIIMGLSAAAIWTAPVAAAELSGGYVLHLFWWSIAPAA